MRQDYQIAGSFSRYLLQQSKIAVRLPTRWRGDRSLLPRRKNLPAVSSGAKKVQKSLAPSCTFGHSAIGRTLDDQTPPRRPQGAVQIHSVPDIRLSLGVLSTPLSHARRAAGPMVLPILYDFKQWLESKTLQVPPSALLGRAVNQGMGKVAALPGQPLSSS